MTPSPLWCNAHDLALGPDSQRSRPSYRGPLRDGLDSSRVSGGGRIPELVAPCLLVSHLFPEKAWSGAACQCRKGICKPAAIGCSWSFPRVSRGGGRRRLVALPVVVFILKRCGRRKLDGFIFNSQNIVSWKEGKPGFRAEECILADLSV